MSRYIDSDLLVRWICGNKCGCERDECGYDIPCQQVQLLEGAPTIEVIHCRECKYYEAKEDWCYWRDEAITADDFCSYGCRDSEKPNNSEKE